MFNLFETPEEKAQVLKEFGHHLDVSRLPAVESGEDSPFTRAWKLGEISIIENHTVDLWPDSAGYLRKFYAQSFVEYRLPKAGKYEVFMFITTQEVSFGDVCEEIARSEGEMYGPLVLVLARDYLFEKIERFFREFGVAGIISPNGTDYNDLPYMGLHTNGVMCSDDPIRSSVGVIYLKKIA